MNFLYIQQISVNHDANISKNSEKKKFIGKKFYNKPVFLLNTRRVHSGIVLVG